MTEIERLREALDGLLSELSNRVIWFDRLGCGCSLCGATGEALPTLEHAPACWVEKARAALAATPPGAERGGHDYLARKIILRGSLDAARAIVANLEVLVEETAPPSPPASEGEK